MIVPKSQLPQLFPNHKCKWTAFVLVFLGTLCHVVCGAAPRPQPRSRIAVVQAVAAVPASERTYAASLADGTLRILTQNGVKADLVSDGALDAALKGRDLAFLVTCTKPTPTQIAALARFRGRGGVIRPLYSAAPQVVSIVGAKPPTSHGLMSQLVSRLTSHVSHPVNLIPRPRCRRVQSNLGGDAT